MAGGMLLQDIVPALPPTRQGPYRYYVLGLLTLVGVCSWVDRQIFAILMQDIKAEFDLSDTQLGLLGGIAFSLFYSTLGLPMAWLADRMNRRNIIGISLAVWSGMTALCGYATGFTSLFLGRIGVGVGEAGGSPPSQSIISDYFAPAERGFALGIFHLYLPLGFMAGFLIGGWSNQFMGWRETFLIVGLPGLLLALVLRLTLREPHRQHLANTSSKPDSSESMLSTLRYFLKVPSLRLIPIAGAIQGIGAWGVGIWTPSYFMRVHDLSSGEVGTWLAFTYGISGSLGVIAGGRLCDRLVRRSGDQRWYLWMTAGCILAAIPFSAVVYLWPTAQVALIAFFVPIFFGHMFLGPVMATIQNLAGPRRRAQGAAFYLFLANLISMGLGPLIIGMSSDFFQSRFGDNSIRYSILALLVVSYSWAALHFFQAARTVRADLAKAATDR